VCGRVFRGFLAEEQAAGHQGQAQSRQVTAGKPTYTRAQILQLHSLRRKGAYSHAEWARLEADIIAAGREGRIAGAMSLDGR